MNKKISEGNVVEEFMLGNTRVKIMDAYLPKTIEENNARIATLERTLSGILGAKVTIFHEGEYKYLDN